MYTSFYKLDIKPFQISSDPDFLWLGEKHKEALATLKYGVLDNKGFLLLTGDVGTGKTTLINSLIESLSEDVIFASVPDPSLSKLDFLNYIALEFGITQEFATKGSFLVGFRKFLIKAHEDNKKVLLIIDEAQLLTQELLEEIRLLSNIEKTHTKLINIFFVGQNEFNDSLNMPQNRAVRQRLTLNYNIDPLTPDETAEYIRYRLKVAGSEQELFEPEAVQEIFMYSGGFPRRINIICDHALLSGYVQDYETIDINTIKECAKDLKIPVYASRPGDTDGFGSYRAEYHPSPTPPPRPAAAMPQPRPVIIQPAVPERGDREFPKRIWLGALGLIAVVLIACYLYFSGQWTQLGFISGQQQAIITNEHVVKAPPPPSGGDPKEIQPDVPKADPPETNVSSVKKKTLQPESSLVKAEKAKTEQIKEQKIESHISPEVFVFPQIEASDDEILENSKNLQPLPEEKIIIRFKYNTNEFTDQGFNVLQEFADILARHPEAKIKITGYSDAAGYKKYNERLSEFRANIVRSFLLGRGADPGQFEVLARGSLDPIATNETAWGRMMNRRVEIEVIQ